METFTVPTAKFGCGLLSDNRSKIPLFPKLCYNVRVASRENQIVFTQYETLYVKQKHHKVLAIHKEPSLLEARRSMSEVYDTLADRLLHLVTSKSGSTVKHLVGMAGPPGAGKSTVAAEVVKRLNKYGKTTSVDFQESTDVAAVLPMDGFHLYRSQLDAMDNPKEAHARRGAPWTFDPERLLCCLKNLRTQGYVYAPSFDHGVGDPVEDEILVNIHHKVVIVEGNYLLLEDGVWKEISLEFDEKWFIDLAIDTAMERVRKRHISTGKTPDIANWRIEYNDRPNAELILKSRKNADIVIKSVDIPNSESWST